MRKILLLTMLLCFMFSSISFAKSSTADFGAVVDDNLVVQAININQPAHKAGLQIGDKIISVSTKDKKITNKEDIKNKLYEDKEETLSIIVEYAGKLYRVVVVKEDNLNTAAKGTFLVNGSPDEIYQKLIQIVSFNNDISPILPIQNVNDNLRLIHTYSSVNRESYDKIPDYAEGTIGNGLKMEALETTGNIMVTNGKNQNTSLVRINLQFRMKGTSIFGVDRDFREASSKGVLERNVISALYKDTFY